MENRQYNNGGNACHAWNYFRCNRIAFLITKEGEYVENLGWKTISVAVSMILYGVFVVGVQGGDWNAALELILQGLALVGLRIGIGKAIAK